MELETQSTLLGTKKEGRFLLPLASVQSFWEHLVTTNKNTSFKTRFKLHYAGLLYPWFARAQKARLTD